VTVFVTIEGNISITIRYNCLLSTGEEILCLSLSCDQSDKNQLLNYNGYKQFIVTCLTNYESIKAKGTQQKSPGTPHSFLTLLTPSLNKVNESLHFLANDIMKQMLYTNPIVQH
jgi:hypothetical protein